MVIHVISTMTAVFVMGTNPGVFAKSFECFKFDLPVNNIGWSQLLNCNDSTDFRLSSGSSIRKSKVRRRHDVTSRRWHNSWQKNCKQFVFHCSDCLNWEPVGDTVGKLANTKRQFMTFKTWLSTAKYAWKCFCPPICAVSWLHTLLVGKPRIRSNTMEWCNKYSIDLPHQYEFSVCAPHLWACCRKVVWLACGCYGEYRERRQLWMTRNLKSTPCSVMKIYWFPNNYFIDSNILTLCIKTRLKSSGPVPTKIWQSHRTALKQASLKQYLCECGKYSTIKSWLEFGFMMLYL